MPKPDRKGTGFYNHKVAGVGTVKGSRRPQKHFPETVVAINKYTGTEYGFVRAQEEYLPLMYVSTVGKNFILCFRENIEILLPEQVTTPNFYQQKALVHQIWKLERERDTNRFSPPKIIDSPKMADNTLLREKCDHFIKSYVPVAAFLDYERFLDNMEQFIKEISK